MKDMKKILFSLLAVLALTACGSKSSEEDENIDGPLTSTPEIEAQGSYIGTFTRILANSATAEPETAEGWLTITASDTAYVAHVRFECQPLGVDAGTVVNISFAGKGFVFYNDLASNTLGSPISGRISEDKLTEANFQLKIRQGRSTKTFDINFSGKSFKPEDVTE